MDKKINLKRKFFIKCDCHFDLDIKMDVISFLKLANPKNGDLLDADFNLAVSCKCANMFKKLMQESEYDSYLCALIALSKEGKTWMNKQNTVENLHADIEYQFEQHEINSKNKNLGDIK